MSVKLVFCVKRLPHLSREDFQKYWRDRHGPLVREAAPALAIRRYGDQPVLVIGTHFATPSAGRIVRDGEAWRLDTD